MNNIQIYIVALKKLACFFKLFDTNFYCDHSVGISTHVITFEVGAVLQDSLSQAPAYCFSQESEKL